MEWLDSISFVIVNVLSVGFLVAAIRCAEDNFKFWTYLGISIALIA